MIIRKMRSEEWETYLDLSKQFYHSEAVLHDIDENYHRKAFQEIINNSPFIEGYFFECDQQIVGYALLLNSYSREAGGIVIWIDELYIIESYRNLGLGKQFFQWLETNKKAARYRLEYSSDNKRVAEFYRKQGFTPLDYLQMIKENKA